MKQNFYYLLTFCCLFVSSCSPEPKETFPRGTILDTPSELISLKSGAIVERNRNGDYIYSGDILLTKKQLDLLDKTGSIFEKDSFKQPRTNHGIPVPPTSGLLDIPSDLRALGKHPSQNMFWSIVRYTFSENLSDSQKEIISQCISIIERETNARFYNATGLPTKHPTYGFDYPYVEFTPQEANNSNIGRIGGKQVINLYNFTERTIIHEICHTLGMIHEQCRPDRDSHVTVHYDNIDPNDHHNFAIERTNYYWVGAFDFESIMLYGSHDFAVDPFKPAMTKKDGSTFSKAMKLSRRDRAFINRFYLPLIAREDVCLELDTVVYNFSNEKLTKEAISQLQTRLNRGRCRDF